MFKIRQKPNGEYYWLLTAPNGQVIAQSHVEYASLAAVENGIESVRNIAPTAQVFYYTQNKTGKRYG